MRVLIEHVTTGRFLTREATWVTEADAALSFENILQAIDHCWAARVFEVVLYLKSDVPGLDVRLDVFRKTPGGSKGRW